MPSLDEDFLRHAIDLAKTARQHGEYPFGAILVVNQQLVHQTTDHCMSYADPTAHAEVTAIRNACKQLNTFQLEDCELYTSCEPCPMCLGAIYWSKIKKIYYACTRSDAASIGFSDDFIYNEIPKALHERTIPIEQVMWEEAMQVFKEWMLKPDRITY